MFMLSISFHILLLKDLCAFVELTLESAAACSYSKNYKLDSEEIRVIREFVICRRALSC